MAAKRKKRPLRVQCTFVYSPEERDMLSAVAEAEGRSASNWIRRSIATAYAKLEEKRRAGR